MAQITITIGDEYINRVREAFNGMAGKELRLAAKGMIGEITHTYEGQQEGETMADYGARICREATKLLIRLYETDKDRTTRYQPAVDAVEAPSADIPEDLVT